MKFKSLKIPAIIMAIGLVLAVIAHLAVSVVRTPDIASHDFDYSVTYQLDGETKTLEGVYRCSYAGYGKGSNPHDRYYTEEYIVNGEEMLSHACTIAEKDGVELYIVTIFDSSYLMGDTKDRDYRPFLEDPFLEAMDGEGNQYGAEELPDMFDAKIVSWEYPEPVENRYRFDGFSLLYDTGMVAMLAVGLAVIVACMIFVKKEKDLRYGALDIVSIVLNFVICLAVLPFIAVTAAFFQITMNTDDLVYQIYLCIPALIAFTVAASIALRRKGFRKTGFFIQFIGPVLYIIPLLSELF